MKVQNILANAGGPDSGPLWGECVGYAEAVTWVLVSHCVSADEELITQVCSTK